MIQHELLVTIVATIVLGVAAQVIAEKKHIPSIIFLLSFGIVAGPDVLGVVHPHLLGEGLYSFTALAVAIILFEGGLTLEIRNVRQVSRSVFNLITVGALVTWFGAALFAWLLLDISLTTAVLFGSLVIVTGPTVIGPLLRTVKVNRRVQTILKWEGILIDPVGAIIAVLVFGFILSEESTLLGTLAGFLGRILIGIVLGLAGGALMTRIMKLHLGESLNTLSIFAFIFLTFGLSEVIIRESGIMSVTIAGIVLGNLRVPNLGNVKGFKEKLTILLVSVLFILLAANLRIADVTGLGLGGVLVVLALMFIVRPVNIWASVREASVTLNEKLFLGWIAPRGIVAAAVASVFAFTMQGHDIHGATVISALTFLTIGMTVFFQGVTAKPMARMLNVLRTGSTGVIILGGNGFTIGLAKLLSSSGVAVAIMDSNRTNQVWAENLGIPALRGDVLRDDVWDESDLTKFGAFMAGTTNNELNSLACIRAADHFGKDKVFQVRNSYRGEAQEFRQDMIRGNQHYDCRLDIHRISEKLLDGTMRLTLAPAVTADTAGEAGRTFVCGLKKGEVIFSTDPAMLRDADRTVVLTPETGTEAPASVDES